MKTPCPNCGVRVVSPNAHRVGVTERFACGNFGPLKGVQARIREADAIVRALVDIPRSQSHRDLDALIARAVIYAKDPK